jgi:hypothetical protein
VAFGHGLKNQPFDLNQQEFIGPFLLIGRKCPRVLLPTRDRTPVSVCEEVHAMTIAEYAILGTLIVVVMVSVCLGFLGREF